MSFNPNRSSSGAFEEAFEAWLNKSKDGDDDDDVSEDDVLLIEPPNHSNDNFTQSSFAPSPETSSMSYPSPAQPPSNTRPDLVKIRRNSHTALRYHAYRAVLKKYSKRRRVLCKKSLSPGSLTDDSGVVSPGCDPALGNLKDVLNGESDGCLSGNDSPPNIQDDFTSANGWTIGTSYPDHPPELIPSHGVLEGMPANVQNSELNTESSLVCSSSTSDKRSDLCDVYPSGCESYGYSSKEERRSKSRKHCYSSHSETERHKFERSNSCHPLESQTYSAGDAQPCARGDMLEKKCDPLCMERTLSEVGDGDTASYVSRNGCEIGASDSGAGSQSESCCEESPRHEHDNLVSSGHPKTKSPQFSCDGHRFTVIPSDSTNKTNSSGSPPLVLKLKKCELKSNIKNSPPKYEVAEASEPCVTKPEPEHVEDEVFHSHSLDVHKCEAGPSRSKRSKSARNKSAEICPCCIGPKSSSKRKRHSRSLTDCSQASHSKKSLGALASNERRFLRQSLHLSSLQTKVHTLFCLLFPRLQLVLSEISPEGRDFNQMIDQVINLLQKADTDDDKKNSEDLSGELEHLTLKGGHSIIQVFDPQVVLCRSPALCLEEFREKVFLLVQLLLPELTLSIENNCFRSHRELEKFLDKIIHANRTNV